MKLFQFYKKNSPCCQYLWNRYFYFQNPDVSIYTVGPTWNHFGFQDSNYFSFAAPFFEWFDTTLPKTIALCNVHNTYSNYASSSMSNLLPSHTVNCRILGQFCQAEGNALPLYVLPLCYSWAGQIWNNKRKKHFPLPVKLPKYVVGDNSSFQSTSAVV